MTDTSNVPNGKRISELTPNAVLNDADILPIAAPADDTYTTGKGSISNLRRQLNFENAFDSIAAGLAATVNNQIFHVWDNADKIRVTEFININGVASPIFLPDGVNKKFYLTPQAVVLLSKYVSTNEYPTLDNGRKILGAMGDSEGGTVICFDDRGGAHTGGVTNDTSEIISDRYVEEVKADKSGRPIYKVFSTGHTIFGLNQLPAVPPAVFHLNLPSLYYADGVTENPAAEPIRTLLRLDLNNFNMGLYKYSLACASDGDSASGRVAAEWLYDWAMRRSMTNRNGSGNPEGSYDRHWRVPNFCMSYMIVKKEIPVAMRDEIVAWFTDLGAVLISDFDGYSVKTNNHSYWCAAAVYACYVITGVESFKTFALTIYDQAMARIESNGTITSEMGRSVRILYYHSFASDPLVMMCELAIQKGEDLYNRDPRLFKLLKTTMHGAYDSVWFSSNAGVSYVMEPITSGGFYPFVLLRYPALNEGWLTIDDPRWGSQFFMGQNGGSTQLAKLWVK
ncbi:alginate lyase family protein [Sodalis sp. RH18]|uniref:alginate lyase family protein n=1 Tax=Sodalis sp. RH18 TaxID=3394333 RepID=UPI0039B59597